MGKLAAKQLKISHQKSYPNSMQSLLSKIVKDLTTGIDGATYDPGRVVGYGLCVVGAFAFVFCSIWATIHDTKFDAQAYGIGFGALMTSLAAVAGGLRLKSNTEPPAN